MQETVPRLTAVASLRQTFITCLQQLGRGRRALQTLQQLSNSSCQYVRSAARCTRRKSTLGKRQVGTWHEAKALCPPIRVVQAPLSKRAQPIFPAFAKLTPLVLEGQTCRVPIRTHHRMRLPCATPTPPTPTTVRGTPLRRSRLVCNAGPCRECCAKA